MMALLIGGSGFIGSHLAEALVANGVAVRILSRSARLPLAPRNGAQTIIGDYGDPAVIRKALFGIDVVFHLASSTVPVSSNAAPVADINENLISTVKLMAAMREQGVRRLVFFSSGGAVYGAPKYNPVDEDHPRQPLSSYGIVKSAIENYIFMEHALRGLSYVIIRPANPYGPRQGNVGLQGVISTFLSQLVRGYPLQIWGNGSVVRDFIYIEDLVKFSVRVAQSKVCGIYNVGSGIGHSVNDVVNVIGNVLITGRVPETIGIEHLEARNIDVPHVVLDIARAKEVFGWVPTVELAEGIERTWKWIRENHGNDLQRTVR